MAKGEYMPSIVTGKNSTANDAMRLPMRTSSMPARTNSSIGVDEQRQRDEVGRPDHDRQPEDGGRGLTIGKPSADEIADRQRAQHGRDQRGPGVDAAAEIRVEIARAEHLEAHDDRAGDERHDVDQPDEVTRHAERPRGRRFECVLRHGVPSVRHAAPKRLIGIAVVTPRTASTSRAAAVPAAGSGLVIHLARALDPIAEIDVGQAHARGRARCGRGS